MIKRRELTEVDMNTNLTFTTGGFPQLTFVLVNERMPRNNAHCALCGGTIEKGYVRDFRTRLVYCDTQCFAGWAHIATPVSKNHGRKVSENVQSQTAIAALVLSPIVLGGSANVATVQDIAATPSWLMLRSHNKSGARRPTSSGFSNSRF